MVEALTSHKSLGRESLKSVGYMPVHRKLWLWYVFGWGGVLYPPNPRPSRPTINSHRDVQTKQAAGSFENPTCKLTAGIRERSAQAADRFASVGLAEEPVNHQRTVCPGVCNAEVMSTTALWMNCGWSADLGKRDPRILKDPGPGGRERNPDTMRKLACYARASGKNRTDSVTSTGTWTIGS